MIVIAHVFPKIQTVKDLVKPLSWKLRFRTSFHSQGIKVLMGSKQLWNLHESTFIKYFNTSEKKWFGKNLPYWNLKSYGSFLTHWLQMISILFAILRICSSLFKCNFHKIEELFSVFSLSVLESSSYFKHFEKKDYCHS